MDETLVRIKKVQPVREASCLLRSSAQFKMAAERTGLAKAGQENNNANWRHTP